MKMLRGKNLAVQRFMAGKSGVAHMIYDDEENTILALKKFLAYLPSNNVENPPGCR